MNRASQQTFVLRSALISKLRSPSHQHNVDSSSVGQEEKERDSEIEMNECTRAMTGPGVSHRSGKRRKPVSPTLIFHFKTLFTLKSQQDTERDEVQVTKTSKGRKRERRQHSSPLTSKSGVIGGGEGRAKMRETEEIDFCSLSPRRIGEFVCVYPVSVRTNRFSTSS